MSSKRKKYSKEFKEEAIALAESMGSISEAARQLGISDSLIHSWKGRLKGKIKGNGNASSPAEAENQRLRKEIAELKKINLILKTAAAFFSQDHLK